MLQGRHPRRPARRSDSLGGSSDAVASQVPDHQVPSWPAPVSKTAATSTASLPTKRLLSSSAFVPSGTSSATHFTRGTWPRPASRPANAASQAATQRVMPILVSTESRRPMNRAGARGTVNQQPSTSRSGSSAMPSAPYSHSPPPATPDYEAIYSGIENPDLFDEFTPFSSSRFGSQGSPPSAPSDRPTHRLSSVNTHSHSQQQGTPPGGNQASTSSAAPSEGYFEWLENQSLW